MVEALNRVSFLPGAWNVAASQSYAPGTDSARTRLEGPFRGAFYFGHSLIGFTTASENKRKEPQVETVEWT